jgi:hypothetical protein
MKQVYFLMLLAVFTSLPAHAGQGTIRETDEQIIIEYSGDDSDAKAPLKQKEELAKEGQEQNRLLTEEAKKEAGVDKESAGPAINIRETDMGMVVEYAGGEDGAKAALQHKEELAREEQEQNRRQAAADKEKARAARRAATRPEGADD